MTRKHAGWAVLCAAALTAVAACGSTGSVGPGNGSGGKAATKVAAPKSSPSPKDNGVAALTGDEISKKAETALVGAASVHVAGTMADDDGTLSMDLTITKAGDCRGTVGMGAKGSTEIIKIGDRVWMKPDQAFWNSQTGSPKKGEAVSALVGDRYLYGTTADDELKQMSSVCDLASAFGSDGSKDDDSYSRGGRTTVGTTPAITVRDTRDKSVLYVATEGEPYPLKAEGGGSDSGSILFTDYGKPMSTATPSAADSLAIAKLQGM